jgi:hypothetical protein
MKASHRRLALALCLPATAGGAAGCSYEYAEPVQQSASAPRSAAASPSYYLDPEILAREVRNYGELDQQLKAAPGRVILFEEGPLDGPVRGFGTTAKVPEDGLYTIAAACAGASGAKISIGQEEPGAPFQPEEFSLDCAGATTREVALRQGYIFAHLVLPAPGDTPWTGAVGGVRITR